MEPPEWENTVCRVFRRRRAHRKKINEIPDPSGSFDGDSWAPSPCLSSSLSWHLEELLDPATEQVHILKEWAKN